jgi:hypothetical protein
LYGRYLELLVVKAMVTQDYDERKAFVSYMVRLMKSFFQVWNKDTIETSDCLQQILELSGFKLQREIDDLRRDGLMESSPRDGSSNRQRSQQNQPQGSQFRDHRGNDNRGGDRDNRDRNRGNDRNDRNKNFGSGNYKSNSDRNSNSNTNNNKRRPR